MADSARSTRVLVIGKERHMTRLVRDTLQRRDLDPVGRVVDGDAALAIAHRRRPQLIVLDFDLLGRETEVLADSLHFLAPQSWIIDFAGILRRRPEHAPVCYSATRPFVIQQQQRDEETA